MDDFGVVYIHTGGIYRDMMELSRSTLPDDTRVAEIVADDRVSAMRERLMLPHDLPFPRTLYIDVDVVYLQDNWPSWLTTLDPPIGLAAASWWHSNTLWKWPESWRPLVHDLQDFANVPAWHRHIASGLMLMTTNCAATFELWRAEWEYRVGMFNETLIEPAFVGATRRLPSPVFEVMPGDFHVPSYAVLDRFAYSLQRHYFVHAIAEGRFKLPLMQQLLERFAANAD